MSSLLRLAGAGRAGTEQISRRLAQAGGPRFSGSRHYPLPPLEQRIGTGDPNVPYGGWVPPQPNRSHRRQAQFAGFLFWFYVLYMLKEHGAHHFGSPYSEEAHEDDTHGAEPHHA